MNTKIASQPTTMTLNFAPIAELVPISLDQANELLVAWNHKMGPIKRGAGASYGRDHSFALLHLGIPVAMTATDSLIRETVATLPQLNRENAIELSRLCAARSGLCRVMLRMWREFIFPTLGYQYAVSYQDADLHNGNTYRFDGWKRAGYSHSGTDQRSGRKGRNKWVWVWPELPTDKKESML